MKKTLALALVLVLAASLAACGGAPGSGISSAPLPQSSSSAVSASLPQSSSSAAPPAGKVAAPPLAPEDIVPWVYAISLDNDWEGEIVIVNQDGREVLRGPHTQILYDSLTGKPRALAQWRMRAAPGEPRPSHDDYFGDCESALYSLSGQILQDWAPGVFLQAFGAYVVHASRRLAYFELSPKDPPDGDFETALVEMNTGEVVLEDAYELTVFSNGTMAVTNATIVLGVIDASLNRVAGFPMRRDYYAIFEWDSRYLADAVQPMMSSGEITGYVLNADFSEQTAFPGWQMATEGLGGGCLIRSSSDELVDADTGEVVLDLPDAGFTHANYYDGEVMVGVDFKLDWDERGWHNMDTYALTTADGAVIAGGFQALHSLLYPSIAEVDVFAGVRSGALVLVNRAGDVLKQSAPGAYSDISYYGPDHPRPSCALAEPRFVVSSNTEMALPRGHYDALYDMDFNELIPLGIYTDLLPLADFQSGDDSPRFLKGSRRRGGSEEGSVVDILDLDGNLLLEGLDGLFSYITNQRLVALAGGFIGLMDLSGNWLWKEPWKPDAG